MIHADVCAWRFGPRLADNKSWAGGDRNAGRRNQPRAMFDASDMGWGPEGELVSDSDTPTESFGASGGVGGEERRPPVRDVVREVIRYAAKEHTGKSIEINREILGDDHPWVAEGLFNYAFMLMNAVQYDEAVQIAEQVLAVDEQAMSGPRCDTSNAHNLLSHIYERRGDLASSALGLRAPSATKSRSRRSRRRSHSPRRAATRPSTPIKASSPARCSSADPGRGRGSPRRSSNTSLGPNTGSTSPRSGDCSIEDTNQRSKRTMTSTITLPITCQLAEDGLTILHESDRVVHDRGKWQLELADGESVRFEVADFEHDGGLYRVLAEHSADGGSWTSWERVDHGAESPVFAGPADVEINIRALPQGTGPAATSTTSSGTISTRGRPDEFGV